MSTQTQITTAAQLGLSGLQLLALMKNPAFPVPVSTDGKGNIAWNVSDIAAFLVTWNAAKAHGWKPVPGALPTFPFGTAAAATPGPSYKPEGSASPELFDL
jgi:hypothetical protein